MYEYVRMYEYMRTYELCSSFAVCSCVCGRYRRYAPRARVYVKPTSICRPTICASKVFVSLCVASMRRVASRLPKQLSRSSHPRHPFAKIKGQEDREKTRVLNILKIPRHLSYRDNFILPNHVSKNGIR